MADFRLVPTPATALLATQAGVGIASVLKCQHQQASVDLHFIGTRLNGARPGTGSGRARAEAAIVVPRCVLADTFGALLAQLEHYEGPAAVEEFLGAVYAAQDRIEPQMTALAEQRRDCCDAGFRTGGREHTCTRNSSTEGTP
ncbi:hypothetical protein ABZ714_19575 [Streptomyces sp. NPDC006798]|uniref:hypothetical protein n=1 Tax=Streptomyces sp. NPDC006798 TaxID=3155462 RepID=UPI00340CD1DC